MSKSKRWESAHASLTITRKQKTIVSNSPISFAFLSRLEMQICPLEAVMRRAGGRKLLVYRLSNNGPMYRWKVADSKSSNFLPRPWLDCIQHNLHSDSVVSEEEKLSQPHWFFSAGGPQMQTYKHNTLPGVLEIWNINFKHSLVRHNWVMTVWFVAGCFGRNLGSNSAIIRVVFTSLSEPILLKIQGGEAIYKQTRRVD